MTDRKYLRHLGICIYAAGAITLGIVGLISRDFATNWQRVTPGVPYRHLLAIVAAIWELCGGLLLIYRRTALYGAAMLTAIYSIFVLLWIPPVLAAPGIYDSWGNVFEELSLVIAGLTLCMVYAPQSTRWPARARHFARIYGVCPVSFGLDHIVYFSLVVSFIPKWIPPGQHFWAIVTTTCFLLAAAAILTGIFAGLASRLLTIMILGFELLIWIPVLVAAPKLHYNWSANAISIALTGAAWVIADVLNAPQTAKP